MRSFVLGLLGLVLIGCAGVDFYTDSAMTQKSGFKYYYSKPYVLVKRTAAKEKPVDISVVYLPDLDNPVYAKMRGGLGSHDFKFSLNNGQITSYGQTGDAQVDEALANLAAPFSGIATGIKTLAEADKIDEEVRQLQKQSLDVAKRTAIADTARAVARDLSDIVSDDAARGGSEILSEASRQAIMARARAIYAAATRIEDEDNAIVALKPDAKALRDAAAYILSITITTDDDSDANRVKIRLLNNAKTLQAEANKFDPQPTPDTFELYEVQIGPRGTTLVRVEIPE